MAASKEDLFGIETKDDSEYDSDEIEEKGKEFYKSRPERAGSEEDSDEDSDDGSDNGSDVESAEDNVDGNDLDEEEEADDEEAEDMEEDPRFQLSDETSVSTRKRSKKKVKPLTPEELEKFQKEMNKTGVVYLSRIPPFMKPVKVKQLLSRYAEIGRVYLAPEDAKIAARRKKYAKNNKQNFTEGWVEFKDKKQAKAVAAMLNTQQIGSYHFNS
jgi:ESF2/ABP1 family protein